MQTTVEHVPGETDGVTWRVPVLRFSPRPGALGPSVSLQAALHAHEQPGTGALHVLCGMLRGAEAAGELLGSVTVVPVANPIGLAQHLFGDQMGRFDTASRVNFNREYPLLDRPDIGLLDDGGPWTGAAALKRRLLALALPHDIVLDLHCDDEAVPYLYMHGALWPAGQDRPSRSAPTPSCSGTGLTAVRPLRRRRWRRGSPCRRPRRAWMGAWSRPWSSAAAGTSRRPWASRMRRGCGGSSSAVVSSWASPGRRAPSLGSPRRSGGSRW